MKATAWLGLALIVGVAVPGCSTSSDDNACGTDRARQLVDAAKQSPLLTGVPGGWNPQAVYAECDQDDEFVVAGRVLVTQAPDLDRYLNQQGARRGEDGDGQPCRTVVVSGQPFYVDSGSRTGGMYLEIRHYLTFANTCQAVASTGG